MQEVIKPRLLKLHETARYLGVSVSSLYGFVQRGVITPVGLPGIRGLRFDRAELEELVQKGKAKE